MEQSKEMEYGSRKASPDVLKPRSIYELEFSGSFQGVTECGLLPCTRFSY